VNSKKPIYTTFNEVPISRGKKAGKKEKDYGL